MEEALANLNTHLDTYLSLPTDDTQTPLVGRNLTRISQDPLFLTTALALLADHQLPSQKILLLTIMVKDKFKYDFEMLDPQKLNHYYCQLCRIAAKLGHLHKAVVSNLSQSLALIYINHLTTQDLPIEEYIAPLIPPPQPEHIPLYNYYFKVLGYCASEVSNTRVVVEEQLRHAARNRMREQQRTVLSILNASVQYVWYNPQISANINKKLIIECFADWLDLNFDLSLVCNDNTLIRVVIEVLQDAQTLDINLLEAAADCLQSIIDCIHRDEEKLELYRYLQKQINLMSFTINQRLKQNQLELAEPVLNLTIFYAQKIHKLLVNNYSPTTRPLLIELIKYLYISIKGVAENLLQFWQLLLKQVHEAKLQDTLSPQFKQGVFTQLARALIQLCQYPLYLITELQTTQEHRLWQNHQEAEQIYRIRLRIGTCFDQIAKLIGVNRFVKEVVKLIAQQHHSSPSFWSMLDSCLYSLIQPLKKLQIITDDAVLLVNTYQELTDQNRPCPILIRRTFLRVFKSLFYLKIKDQDLVKKLLFFISQCFQTDMVLDTAQSTFYRGCEENTDLIYHSLTSITDMLMLLKHYPTKEYIVRGVIRLVCLDPNNADQYLKSCLSAILYAATEPTHSPTRKKECLLVLAATFKDMRSLNFPNKNKIIKQFLWGSWDQLMAFLQNPEKKSEDEDVQVERTVKLLKSIMRTLALDFAQFLPNLLETINHAFKTYPICSYVYVLEITVTVFARQHSLTEFLKSIYEEFSRCAYNHLRTPQSLDCYGYLVDDFLGMNSRLILYNTAVIVHSSSFPELLTFVAHSCILSNTPRVLKATYSFLQTLFMLFWSPQFIEEYNKDVEEQGRFEPYIQNIDLYLQLKNYIVEKLTTILKHMLQHLAEVPNQTTRDQILDTLVSQTKAFPLDNRLVWTQLLEEISGNVFLITEKQKMLQLFWMIELRFQQGESFKGELRSVTKMLSLINKRMITNEKRMQLDLDFN